MAALINGESECRLVEVRPARSPVARAGGCSVGVVCGQRPALSLCRALPHFLAERWPVPHQVAHAAPSEVGDTCSARKDEGGGVGVDGAREQGKRYAERWCAARLYPEMRLRAAVARMVDDSPREPLPPLPGLPPTLEQLQQARRLAEAEAKELERVKEVLEPVAALTALG